MTRFAKYSIEEVIPPLKNPFDVVEYDKDGNYVNSWRFATKIAAELFKKDMEDADSG